ncbi:hypothetical protein H4J59_03265 [Colwellia sp. MB02u-10]|uniref:hypothetical protein n=1 Tax=Colwellia sp. MB02u-10 TaxID=2759828 RepID=UPI0015F6F522|nr:hypothetical protein [Colwellia sp. MB02u-10]MBA6340023.1 hypothetical protein [Colwellia sp. MB02u-10]
MNKPMVLVIHGMGTHKSGETKKEIADGFNQAAANFGLTNFDINEKVEFFQFNYSDFLDEIRLKDAAKAGELVKHIGLLQGHGLGEKSAAKLTEFFADFDENKIFYTHWMDVVYYGLMFWGEKIRVDLAKKINDLMIERELGNRKLHIICHSLGTAVLHDTLAKLFRKDADITSEIPQLDIDRFQIDSLWTVANVSRLLNVLNDIADPNHSIVSSDNNGCAKLLFNVRNEFDPFTWFKRYDRPIEHGGRHIIVKTVRKVNTHDLKEYVKAPAVAEAFFSNVLGIIVTEDEYNQGIAKYKLTSLNYSYDALNNKFHDLKEEPSHTGKIELLIDLIKAVDEFKERIDVMIEQD